MGWFVVDGLEGDLYRLYATLVFFYKYDGRPLRPVHSNRV